MAQSLDDMQTRLDRLERDMGDVKTTLIRVCDILIDQSERMDAGFRSIRSEMSEMNRSLTLRIDTVTDRLDRLITATMNGRTQDAERFAQIDQRLSRLEEHLKL